MRAPELPSKLLQIIEERSRNYYKEVIYRQSQQLELLQRCPAFSPGRCFRAARLAPGRRKGGRQFDRLRQPSAATEDSARAQESRLEKNNQKPIVINALFEPGW